MNRCFWIAPKTGEVPPLDQAHLGLVVVKIKVDKRGQAILHTRRLQDEWLSPELPLLWLGPDLSACSSPGTDGPAQPRTAPDCRTEMRFFRQVKTMASSHWKALDAAQHFSNTPGALTRIAEF